MRRLFDLTPNIIARPGTSKCKTSKIKKKLPSKKKKIRKKRLKALKKALKKGIPVTVTTAGGLTFTLIKEGSALTIS